jgi:hypothetical protein
LLFSFLSPRSPSAPFRFATLTSTEHWGVGGTRIAVQSVLEMLAAGDSVDDVLGAFPSLRREQVLACVDHAARLMGNQYSLERVA